LATLLPAEVTDAEGSQRRFQIELLLAAPAVKGDGSPTAAVLRHKAGGESHGFTSDDPMLEALYRLLEDTYPFLLLPRSSPLFEGRFPTQFY
jgi:hypothetical protein